MTATIRKITFTLGLSAVLILFGSVGCRVNYSLSGSSIHADAKTVSIPYFPNSAPLVAPILSPTFTDALQDRFANRTKLSLVPVDGDLALEGEIVGYTSTPTAVTASDQFPAAMNRLTISVRVRFVNNLEPEYNFERTFSHYEDYNSNLTLQATEGELIPRIVETLVDEIFKAAVQNW